MDLQRTLTILKPDAVRAGVQGHMLQRLLDEGFRVVAMRQARLSQADAEGFYAVHRAKPFFGELVGRLAEGLPAIRRVLYSDRRALAGLRYGTLVN